MSLGCPGPATGIVVQIDHDFRHHIAPRCCDMAKRNRLWGAERIRGELLKLGVRVSKRTIQKYMKDVRSRSGGQSWATLQSPSSPSPSSEGFTTTIGEPRDYCIRRRMSLVATTGPTSRVPLVLSLNRVMTIGGVGK
jgi:hypothetical protein